MNKKPVVDIVEQFSSSDLVPHGYIDENLSKYTGEEQLPELHSSASNLLSELDNYSEEITWQLENTMGELVRSTNRLNYEVELLKSDVNGLALDMRETTGPKMKSLLKEAERDSSLEQLKRLDIVKANMEKVRQVFEDAKAFDEQKITQEVLNMLNNGNNEAALARIDHWESVCQVWKSTTVYNAKTSFINGLRKRVQAIVSAAKEEDSNINSSSAVSEVPSRLDSASSDVNKSYYGLINQLQRKIF